MRLELYVEELLECHEGDGEDHIRKRVPWPDSDEWHRALVAPADHEPVPTVPVCQCGPPICGEAAPGQGSDATLDSVRKSLGGGLGHSELTEKLSPLRCGHQGPKAISGRTL